MLGPFATTSRLTPIHQMSLAVLSRAACASMSTTTTTRDRGDRYGPMEWAQQVYMLALKQNGKLVVIMFRSTCSFVSRASRTLPVATQVVTFLCVTKYFFLSEAQLTPPPPYLQAGFTDLDEIWHDGRS